MLTPSQTRLIRKLAAAYAAYNAYESPKTYHKLHGAKVACAHLACIHDGKVCLFETKTVCINADSCSSPRWGEERTGRLVAWHADDPPSRWQPSSPAGYEPSGPADWPASPQWAPPSPRGDRSPTSPREPPPETERAAKRPRAHSPCWLD